MNLTTPSAYRFVTGDDLGKIVLDGQVKPLRGDSSIRGEDLTVLYEQAGQLYQILELGTSDAYVPKLEFSRKITAEQVGKVVEMCWDQWHNLHPQGSHDKGAVIGFADDAYDPDGRCCIYTSSANEHIFLNLAFGDGKWWDPDSYNRREYPGNGSPIAGDLIDGLYEDSRKFKHVARIGRKTNYFDMTLETPTVLDHLGGDIPSETFSNGIHYRHIIHEGELRSKGWYGSPSAEESIGGRFDVNCTNVKMYALFFVDVFKFNDVGGPKEYKCYFIRKMGLKTTWQQIRESALAAMATLGIAFPVFSAQASTAEIGIDITFDNIIMATGDLTHTDWWNWSKNS